MVKMSEYWKMVGEVTAEYAGPYQAVIGFVHSLGMPKWVSIVIFSLLFLIVFFVVWGIIWKITQNILDRRGDDLSFSHIFLSIVPVSLLIFYLSQMPHRDLLGYERIILLALAVFVGILTVVAVYREGVYAAVVADFVRILPWSHMLCMMIYIFAYVYKYMGASEGGAVIGFMILPFFLMVYGSASTASSSGEDSGGSRSRELPLATDVYGPDGAPYTAFGGKLYNMLGNEVGTIEEDNYSDDYSVLDQDGNKYVDILNQIRGEDD